MRRRVHRWGAHTATAVARARPPRGGGRWRGRRPSLRPRTPAPVLDRGRRQSAGSRRGPACIGEVQWEAPAPPRAEAGGRAPADRSNSTGPVAPHEWWLPQHRNAGIPSPTEPRRARQLQLNSGTTTGNGLTGLFARQAIEKLSEVFDVMFRTRTPESKPSPASDDVADLGVGRIGAMHDVVCGTGTVISGCVEGTR